MLLIEWVKNKSLVKAAKQLTDSDTFRRMREVLEDESPLRTPLSPTGPTANDHSRRLGMIEGYQLCLSNLKMLAITPPPVPKEIEATYENPDKE